VREQINTEGHDLRKGAADKKGKQSSSDPHWYVVPSRSNWNILRNLCNKQSQVHRLFTLFKYLCEIKNQQSLYTNAVFVSPKLYRAAGVNNGTESPNHRKNPKFYALEPVKDPISPRQIINVTIHAPIR